MQGLAERQQTSLQPDTTSSFCLLQEHFKPIFEHLDLVTYIDKQTRVHVSHMHVATVSLLRDFSQLSPQSPHACGFFVKLLEFQFQTAPYSKGCLQKLQHDVTLAPNRVDQKIKIGCCSHRHQLQRLFSSHRAHVHKLFQKCCLDYPFNGGTFVFQLVLNIFKTSNSILSAVTDQVFTCIKAGKALSRLQILFFTFLTLLPPLPMLSACLCVGGVFSKKKK